MKKLFKNPVFRVFSCLLLACAAALLAGFLDGQKVRSLPEGERGLLPLMPSRIENAEVTAEGIVMKAGSRVTFEGLPSYVDKFRYTADHPILMDAVVTAQTVGEDGTPGTLQVQDTVPQYLVTSYVPIESKTVSLTLEFTFSDAARGESVLLREAAVSNVPQWNRRLMLSVFAAVFLLGLLVVFREAFSKKAERAFLPAALILGCLFIALLPVNKVSWDEEIHFYRASCVAAFPGGLEAPESVYHQYTAGTFNWPYSQPDTQEEQAAFDAVQAERARGDIYLRQPPALAGQYTSGYLVQGLFLKIGTFLRLPFPLLYRLGRLGNLLSYVLLMYFAIRVLPAGKRVLTAAALMPTPMFLASTYSYDAAVIGFLSLAMALVIREILTPEKKLSWGTFLLAGAAFVLGILPKAVYAPLILTALFLPKSKFKDRRHRIAVNCLVVLAFLAMMSTFVLPMLMNSDYMTDSRGGDTDGSAQIAFILDHPWTYTKLLLGCIFGNLHKFLLGFEVYGQLGHLTASPLRAAFPVLILASLFADRPEKKGQLSWAARAGFLILCGACMVLIWTALYISYTPPGAPFIAGVQPRYYLPILLPVFLIFFTDRFKPALPQGLTTLLTTTAASAVTLYTLYACVYVPFGR